MSAHNEVRPSNEDLRQEAMRLAGLTLAIDAILALFKVSVGVLSGSQALSVSALYSVNDIMSSIAVAVSLRVGGRRPTSDYRYGFGRAEFIAVAMVSLAILIGVSLMFFFSATEIVKGVQAPPHYVAALLAAVSMVVSWWLATRNHHVAEELKSPALATSAEHHHADFHGSALALVGIGAALIGFHVFDRIVATFEEMHLVALSGTLLARAVNGLMDRGLPEEDVSMVERGCAEVLGVERVAHVRSRRLGSLTWVDVGVIVGAELTVAHGTQIRRRIVSVVERAVGGRVFTQVCLLGPRAPLLSPGPGAAVSYP
jgi:cation diffusion facilitator family transporter